ncbi:MAG TPA: hypothetical protein EYP14_07775 [Planctomycetaceae bacterium]|nr:hypothetical protein [Planctomycetaceae bacterium]
MAWSTKQKTEFLEALTAVTEIYGRELSKPAMKLYLKVLEKYPFEAVMRAMTAYIENASGKASYFPKPGDVVALIDGNPEDRATQAWAEVREALERIGTYESVRFRDPIVNACIAELGGWVRLGELDNKAIEFLGNEFRKLYRQFYQTGKVPKVDYLPGRVETENNARGLTEFIPPVVEVGSPLPSNARIALVEKSQDVKALKPEKSACGRYLEIERVSRREAPPCGAGRDFAEGSPIFQGGGKGEFRSLRSRGKKTGN